MTAVLKDLRKDQTNKKPPIQCCIIKSLPEWKRQQWLACRQREGIEKIV